MIQTFVEAYSWVI